mmetsp:Transcript_2847/g.7386  ORF Transcript_2847/g.7386 Transcript_2847/m.7386 type:complete len:553 (-) Transcript_2847:517-2175(-)
MSSMSEPFFHEFSGAQQGAGFRLRLLPFQFGHGVRHDAGGRLHVEHAVLHDAGADGNSQVHVAGKAQVAAGTAVDAALHRLQLVDEFHRAHLGRAAERAGREGGLQHVELAHLGPQYALDVGDDVHHVGVALHVEGLRDLHAAGAGDAADVVAGQVDQHQVLGAFLGIGLELGLQRLVAFGRAATRAGAGQRADRDLAAAVARMLLAHQDLRAGADDLEVAEIVEVHIGAGVQRPQRPVQRDRLGLEGLGQALADDDLHQVAGGDVVLGALHGGHQLGLGEVALHRVVLAARHARHTDRVVQLVAQLGQPLGGAEIGLGLARVGPDDEVEPAGQVVDDGHLFAEQQQDVGRAQAALLVRAGQAFLDRAHRLVAEVAGQAAAEARQAGGDSGLDALLVGGDEVQRVAFMRLDDDAVGDDFAARAGGPHQCAAGQADEGVAPEALAADDGLQQEAVAARPGAVAQLEVEGQRGFEIRKGLADQRDAVVAFGGQALEFEFGDHVSNLERSRSSGLGVQPGGTRARCGTARQCAPSDIRRVLTSDARARLPGRSTP